MSQAETFVLLALWNGKEESPDNAVRFGKSYKFYLPDKHVPSIKCGERGINAARRWIRSQPGLMQPATMHVLRVEDATVVLCLVDEEWRREAGRPSDWVTARTAAYSYTIPFVRLVAHHGLQKLKE